MSPTCGQAIDLCLAVHCPLSRQVSRGSACTVSGGLIWILKSWRRAAVAVARAFSDRSLIFLVDNAASIFMCQSQHVSLRCWLRF